MCNATPSRRPCANRRRSAVLFDALEPRSLFSAVPTTTTLTLSAPVTSANQPLTLTAAVTADPGSPAPTGTVAFFETVDLSRDPYSFLHNYSGTNLVSLPGGDRALLLGTATLSPDGTAALSLGSIPSASAIYTGQFRAAFLGSSSPFDLPNSATLAAPAAGQTLGPNPTPATGTTAAVSYLLFPQNHPLSLHNAELTVLSDLAPGSDAATLTPNATLVHSDQYGNQIPFTIVSDSPSPLTDDYPSAPYVLAPSADPVLVSITVHHNLNGSNAEYPNLYTYTASFTPAPLFAHAFDANPDFQSSLSDVGTAAQQSTSLELHASASTPTFTNPPAFSVSILSAAGDRRLGRTAPAAPSRGDYHSAQAGLAINTGNGSTAGNLSLNGSTVITNPHPVPPFVAPGPFPTGTVSFFDENNTLLATVPLDADGNASFAPDPRSLPLGAHTLHAVYSGDANFLPAAIDSDPFTLTHTPTETTLSPAVNPVHAGDTVSLAASVYVYDTITPTGLVTFSEGDTVLAAVPLGQTSSIHLILSAGTHTITASYAGDADCLPSSATTTVTILTAEPVVPPPYVPQPPYNPGGYFPDPFAGQITDASLTYVRVDFTFPITNRQLPGDTLHLVANVSFTGNGTPQQPTGTFLSFALSADNVAGNADDIPLPGTLFDPAATISLHFDSNGLATRSVYFDAALPADLAPGDYHLVATIDPSNNIAESDETNNTLVSLGTVTIADPTTDTPTPAPTPDLTGSLTPARPTITLNTPASLKLTLTNPSKTKSVTRKYTVTYYLSDDATYSDDDTKFSKQTITAALARKQTKSYALSYKLPKATPLGTRYLIAVADAPTGSPGTAHLELASAKPLKILGPHLAASVRSVTPTSRPDTVKVTVRVLNDGSAPFAGPATLRLLSDAPTVDTLLLTARKSVTLKSGKYADYTFTVRRPAGATLSVTVA